MIHRPRLGARLRAGPLARRLARLLVAGAPVVAGCVAGSGARRAPIAPPHWSSDLPAPRLTADSTLVDTIARGVLHRVYFVRSAPWVIHVLDVDRAACWAPVAVKGATGAVGRRTTTELVRSLAAVRGDGGDTPSVAGAVNADFFLFNPPGVPVGLHVHDGRLTTGPAARPVFALDSAGRPFMGSITVEGAARAGADTFALAAWNRAAPKGLALFDAAYGPEVDTARGSIRVTLSSVVAGEVAAIDTAGGPTPIPERGAVLVLGGAPDEVRARFLTAARSRGGFDVAWRLTPFHPREAVGGFPILVRGGAEVAGLDSAGAATFAPVRHPRTVVAVAAAGRRLMLVTVDGRQPGHSAGMTLRELARLALDLGASDAINLDGGGSTAMAVAKWTDGGWRYPVVNRPSDPQGERAVGNALAIVASCR